MQKVDYSKNRQAKPIYRTAIKLLVGMGGTLGTFLAPMLLKSAPNHEVQAAVGELLFHGENADETLAIDLGLGDRISDRTSTHDLHSLSDLFNKEASFSKSSLSLTESTKLLTGRATTEKSTNQSLGLSSTLGTDRKRQELGPGPLTGSQLSISSSPAASARTEANVKPTGLAGETRTYQDEFIESLKISPTAIAIDSTALAATIVDQAILSTALNIYTLPPQSTVSPGVAEAKGFGIGLTPLTNLAPISPTSTKSPLSEAEQASKQRLEELLLGTSAARGTAGVEEEASDSHGQTVTEHAVGAAPIFSAGNEEGADISEEHVTLSSEGTTLDTSVLVTGLPSARAATAIAQQPILRESLKSDDDDDIKEEESETDEDAETGNEEADPGSELGDLNLQEVQIRGDDELGVLRLLQTAQAPPPPPEPPIAFLTGKLGYFNTANAFRSNLSRLNEEIAQSGLTLYFFPRLTESTNLYAIAETQLARYEKFDSVSYNELEFQLGIRQKLLPRTYAQLGWRNQRLYTPGFRERLFSVNYLDTLVSHRSILNSKTWLDSFYQARLGFADPETSSRFRQTFTVSLNYGINRDLRTSLLYQLDFDDYTQVSRFDTYQQILGIVSYNITPESRVSLFGGTRFGRSSNPNVNLDDTFYGAGLNVSVPLF